jgi:transposase
MRKGTTVEVSAADQARLESVVADRDSPRKHVWRARIILATAEGLGTNVIMRRTGKSKPCVWRWQARFMAEGVAGLLRDKTRPPGTPPLPEATVERVVELTRQEPPGEATHWTGRAMAKAAGVSLGAVQGIWKAHGLVPHRVRTFKLSKDPEFVAKLRDIVGLYMSPPAHAVGSCRGVGRNSAAWSLAGMVGPIRRRGQARPGPGRGSASRRPCAG